MAYPSVWLGAARRPVMIVTAASVLFAGLLGTVLAAGSYFFDSGVTMHDILRPGERFWVKVEIWAIFIATISAAIYLSDFRSKIEITATGPMDLFSLVLARVALILVIALVLVMFFEVVARYVFEKPTLWANEMTLWFAGFIYMLAGLYAMQQRSHIRIYTVYDRMPRFWQKMADSLGVLLVWGFAGALVWGGFNEALDKLLRLETFGTAWDPPLPGTIKPAILLIMVIVAVQALFNLIADWNKPAEHHAVVEIDEEEIEMIRRNLEVK